MYKNHKGMGLFLEYDLTNIFCCCQHAGPWSANTEQFNDEFYALTCIDTTTNIVKLVCIDTKSSDASAKV